MENLITAGPVDLIPWPESQGCIGCKFTALVNPKNPETYLDSTYVCLAKDRKKALCDNPEKSE